MILQIVCLGTENSFFPILPMVICWRFAKLFRFNEIFESVVNVKNPTSDNY